MEDVDYAFMCRMYEDLFFPDSPGATYDEILDTFFKCRNANFFTEWELSV